MASRTPSPPQGRQTGSGASTWPNERPSTIRVISLNCWGLKYISKHRHERLAEIGRQLALASPPPDIVGLQECWTQQDYRSIRAQTQHLLPHGKFYYSGIFGGGLAVLSRFPLEESNMLRYPLNGRPAAFYRGDWYVGKGIASATLRIGPGEADHLVLLNTHLHAPYEREPRDSYLCHRTAQAWEMARAARHAAQRGHLVVALGDFNMVPLSLAHRLIEAHSPVRDVWRLLWPDSAVGAARSAAEQARGKSVPSAARCLAEHGCTCDSSLNTWRWSKEARRALERGREAEVDLDAPDDRARRLDYVFFADNARMSGGARWRVAEARVGMTMRHPTLRCSLSDHFSIEATLERVVEGEAEVKGSSGSATTSTEATQDEKKQSPRAESLPVETYDTILAMITQYEGRERGQRRARITHFFAQLAVTTACLVAVWWSPRNFVAFLLMLLSSLGLSAGVVDGLMGFLFVGSELRALREFEWEIRSAREVAVAAHGHVDGASSVLDGSESCAPR